MSSALPYNLPPGSKIYIVGLGGIGTSAIAQWLKDLGAQVSGTDAVASDITNWLNQVGIPVQTGAPVSPKDPPQLLIYSDSVSPDHPLRQFADQHNIPQYSYAEALGELTRGFVTIAISGSHGKSSTTAMTGLLLESLGLDPTVVIGTRVPQWQNQNQLGNYRPGQSKICVVEADEYRDHFHYLSPYIAVITSIDHDHVDAFPTAADYLKTFQQFIAKISPVGTIVIEQQAHDLLKSHLHQLKEITYTISAPYQSNITSTPPVIKNHQQSFALTINGVQSPQISLAVPGQHMIANLLAACGCALAITDLIPKISIPAIIAATKKFAADFHGTWRRFESIGTFNQAPAFSDYAHHPTEIAALIASVQQFYPDRRLVLALQPHHHNRARAFAADFKQVLKNNLKTQDQIVFVEVYGVPGRENQAEAITTQDWAKEFSAPFVPTLDQLKPTLQPLVKSDDILVFAGAGDIDAIARQIVD